MKKDNFILLILIVISIVFIRFLIISPYSSIHKIYNDNKESKKVEQVQVEIVSKKTEIIQKQTTIFKYYLLFEYEQESLSIQVNEALYKNTKIGDNIKLERTSIDSNIYYNVIE